MFELLLDFLLGIDIDFHLLNLSLSFYYIYFSLGLPDL